MFSKSSIDPAFFLCSLVSVQQFLCFFRVCRARAGTRRGPKEDGPASDLPDTSGKQSVASVLCVANQCLVAATNNEKKTKQTRLRNRAFVFSTGNVIGAARSVAGFG